MGPGLGISQIGEIQGPKLPWVTKPTKQKRGFCAVSGPAAWDPGWDLGGLGPECARQVH